MNVGTTAAPPMFGSAAIETPTAQGRGEAAPDNPALQPPVEAAKPAGTGLIVDKTV